MTSRSFIDDAVTNVAGVAGVGVDRGQNSKVTILSMLPVLAVAFGLVMVSGTAIGQEADDDLSFLSEDDAETDFIAEAQAEGDAIAVAESEAEADAEAEAEIAAADAAAAKAEANPEIDAQAANPAKRLTGQNLDEVIVTANKREQNLQEVPLSIQVIGGDELKDRSIDSMNELSFIVPSFSVGVADGGIGGSIMMRGVASSNNRGMEQEVGLVIDDIPYGRIEYAVDNFLDVDRVEILRGPQGTTLGKNAVAGAIVLHSMDPSHDAWSAEVTGVAFVRNDGGFGSLILNAPVWEDVLALRAAWRSHYARLTDYRNTTDDRPSFQRKHVGRFKARLDFTPNLYGIASAMMVDSDTQGSFTQQKAASPYWRAVNEAYDPEFETDDEDQKTSIDIIPRLFKDALTFGGELHWDMGSGWFSQYIGGYSTFDQSAWGDIDFMPIPLLTARADDTFTQTSHEIRILSPKDFWDDRVSFVLGFNYFWANFDGYSRIGAGEIFDLSGTVQERLTPDQIDLLLQQLGIPNPEGDDISADGSAMIFDQIATQYALFGQADWNLLPELVLTTGLRFSFEEKEIDMERKYDMHGLVFSNTVGSEEFAAHLEREEQSISPRLSLRYQITDELMFFGTYGQGHKSGGFNANAGTEAEAEFDEEVSNTFEIGMKSSLFDRRMRLNATLFYTTFDDFQFSAFNGVEFVVENAASVVTRGLEMDGFAFLGNDIMMLYSYAFTKATYSSFPDGPCQAGVEGPCNLKGKELHRAPKHTGSVGFGKLFRLGNRDQDFILGIDGTFKSDTFLDADLDPNSLQPAYGLLNLWFQLRGDDESWSVTFRLENAFDQFYNTSIFDTPVATGGFTTIPGGRRGMNLSAKMKF